MKDVVIRFLTLNAQNVIDYVYFALVAVWIVMVMVTLFSIRSQDIGAAAKASWTLMTVFLPIFGIGLYCLRCLWRADYPLLEQLGFTRSKQSVGLAGSQNRYNSQGWNNSQN